MKRKNILALIGISTLCGLGSFFVNYPFMQLNNKIAALEEQNRQLLTENQNMQTELEMKQFIIEDNTRAYNENIMMLYDKLGAYMETVSYEDTVHEYSYDDIILLSKVVQTEAGVKNYAAQEAITCVILNRVNSEKFPNTIYDVVYQRNAKAAQFSVAYNGMLDRCDLNYETLINVCKVLSENNNYPANMLFFCAEPADFTSYANYYATIEGTKFYTK